MKKYQQLLLTILSIFSFLCLLIYRHEYYKLRYVLEVLNFFGTPGASTKSSPVWLRNNSFAFTEPQPAWQRISNTLYVYSAFWEKVNGKEHVKAFAIGSLNENYGCYLWYDFHPKTRMGQFSAIGFKSKDLVFSNKGFVKSKTKAFVFYCESGAKGVKPVGVTFFKTSVNDTMQGFLPVANVKSDYPPANSTGICILPTPFPYYNQSTYLEFLSFHQIVGVNNFLAYGANDQYNLFSSIQTDPCFKIDLTLLQWNYPFFSDTELMKLIAENDCILRTMGIFENVIIIEWNKLLVPRYLPSISKLINELDRKTYKFQISTLLFCTEYEDNIQANSSSVLFKKTRYSLPKLDMSVAVYRPHLKSGSVTNVGKSLIAAHQYTSCRNYKVKSGEKKSDRSDKSILRFQNDLLNSRLLKIYKYYKSNKA